MFPNCFLRRGTQRDKTCYISGIETRLKSKYCIDNLKMTLQREDQTLHSIYKVFYKVKIISQLYAYILSCKKFIMSNKKQATLAAFGFTKSIIHRGEEVPCKIPKVTKGVTKLKCDHCSMEFVNQQGLTVHVKCKHPLNINETISVHDNALLKKVDKPMTEVVNLQASQGEGDNANELVIAVGNTKDYEKVETGNRHGRDIRKSLTNKFKSKTIAEVESGMKSIDVAEKYHVNRSQISNWTKNKDKIT